VSSKTYRRFDDVVPDSVIGGDQRHVRAELPSDIVELPGLVGPADPGTIKSFQESIRDRPLVIEVGPGKGAFLTALATLRPDFEFVGFESRLAYCLKTLDRAKKAGVGNVWAVWGDARVTIPMLLNDGRADEAYLLFPDPWWKKRHSRRRHGPEMARVLTATLVKGGLLVVKSDVEGYLDDIVEACKGTGLLEDRPLPTGLPLTNREMRIHENMQKVFAAAMTRR